MTDQPLSEQEIIAGEIIVLVHYLVNRQGHIDMTEEDVEYNVIKYSGELLTLDFASS